MTMTSCDDGHNWEVGGSDAMHILTAAHYDKRPVRPPTDHFKRLLEEACPNHAYFIGHRLKDCGMMRSFITPGSHTWGVELDEGPDRSDTMPFPRKTSS
jgi:hypothetical protein